MLVVIQKADCLDPTSNAFQHHHALSPSISLNRTLERTPQSKKEKSPGKGCPAGQNTVGKRSWSPLPQGVAVAPHSRDLTFKHMKQEGKVLEIRAHYCFPSLFYSLMCSQHFNQNEWLLPAGWFWISSMLYLLLILLPFLERPSL